LLALSICLLFLACSDTVKTDEKTTGQIEAPDTAQVTKPEANAVDEAPLMAINDVGVTYMRSYDELVVERCVGSIGGGNLTITARGTDVKGDIDSEGSHLALSIENKTTTISYFTPNGLMVDAVSIDLDTPLEMRDNGHLEFSGRDPSGRPFKAELRCDNEENYDRAPVTVEDSPDHGLTDSTLTQYHADKWDELGGLGLEPWLRCEIMALENTSKCHDLPLYRHSDLKKIQTGFNQFSLDVGYPSNTAVTAILVVKDEGSPGSERSDPSGEKWVSDLDLQVNGQSVGFTDEQFFGLTDIYELSVMSADVVKQKGDGFYLRFHMGTDGATGPYTAQYLISLEDCSASGGELNTPFIAEQMRWSDIMGEGSLTFSKYGNMACQ